VVIVLAILPAMVAELDVLKNPAVLLTKIVLAMSGELVVIVLVIVLITVVELGKILLVRLPELVAMVLMKFGMLVVNILEGSVVDVLMDFVVLLMMEMA
jgi:hypothetical protein